jgi:hypothetical protein
MTLADLRKEWDNRRANSVIGSDQNRDALQVLAVIDRLILADGVLATAIDYVPDPAYPSTRSITVSSALYDTWLAQYEPPPRWHVRVQA